MGTFDSLQFRGRPAERSYRVALDFLRYRLPGAERALVLLEDPYDGVVTAYETHGFEVDFSYCVSWAILERCLRDQKPLILADALQEPNLREDDEVKMNHLRSVICVPFLDHFSKRRGLLYADNCSEAAQFDYDDLDRTKQFAELLSSGRKLRLSTKKSLIALLKLSTGATGLLLLGMAVSWASGGVAWGALTAGPPKVTPSPVANLEERPWGLVQRLLDLMTRQQWEQALELTSSEVVPATKQFPGVLKKSVATAPKLMVRNERVEGNHGMVTVANQENPAQTWQVECLKTPEGWRISHLDPRLLTGP